MLPNTLPLIGDGCGDALCMRIGPDGSVTEFVSWDHDGGEWSSEGRSLAEALLSDAAGSERVGGDLRERFRFADWAMPWVGISGGSFAEFTRQSGGPGDGVRLALLSHHVAEVPLREARCWELLETGLDRRCEPGKPLDFLAGEQEAFSPWPFDMATVPDASKRRISRRLRRPIEELFGQDWAGAAREAERVRQIRPDLAWPHSVLGWEAERRGDLPAAIGHYTRGLRTLATGEGFTERWKPATTWNRAKFPALRLEALWSHLPPDLQRDPYLRAHGNRDRPGPSWQERVRNYWIAEGEHAEAEGRHLAAYTCYYYAGWDYGGGVTSSLLEHLVRAAGAAGSEALRRLAEAHMRSAPTDEEHQAGMRMVEEALRDTPSQADFDRVHKLYRRRKKPQQIADQTGIPLAQVENIIYMIKEFLDGV